jgi:hypothetical protein
LQLLSLLLSLSLSFMDFQLQSRDSHSTVLKQPKLFPAVQNHGQGI